MTLDEKVARRGWLWSQERWHRRQPPSKWHKSQIRWFRNQAARALTFSDLVSLTFRRHTRQVVENAASSNALLARITRQ